MGRPRLYAIAVVVMALLVVTATPAGAADVAAPDLEVASEHTSESDFSGASLTNMSVSGDGESVVMATEETYSVINDTGGGSTGWQETLVGETASDVPYDVEIGARPNFDGTVSSITVQTEPSALADYQMDVDIYAVQESPDGSYEEGTLVKEGWLPNIENGYQTIDLDTFFTVSSGETWTIEFITTNNDPDGDYEVLEIPVEQNAGENFYSRDGSLDDSYANLFLTNGFAKPDSSQYVGANHTTDAAEEAWTNLTLDNASATVEWQGWTGSQWATVDSSTYSTSGNKTVGLSGGYSKWRTAVDFDSTGGEPTGELHDEGVLFDAAAPQFDASTGAPTGEQTSEPQTLSIEVSDRDFARDFGTTGETVGVEFFGKGPSDSSFQSVGNTDVTSNSTASVPFSPDVGGQWEWYAVAEDSFGKTTTSQTFEFALPSSISVYNESDSPELVDDVNATIRFYANTTTDAPLTVTRTTDDGTIDMEGLPVTESFIVTADAPGYVSRRIFVESVFETPNLYLLNESVQHTQTIFELQDYTGSYPQDTTVLEVQRVLNGTWQTVAGDYFGANNQFPTQLTHNARHRLIIRNIETDDSRILGTYTPISSASETLIISPAEPIPEPDEPPSIDVRPGTRQLPTRADVSVNTTVERGSTPLANYSVSLTHVNGSGNTTLATLDGVDESGETLRETLDLSAFSDGEVVVVASVTTGTGNVVTERVHYDVRTVYSDTHTLLDGLNGLVSLAGSTAGAFTAFLAFAMTIVGTAAVATQFRLSSEMVGLIGVGWVTAFAAIGWVSYDLLFVVLVAWAALSYLGRVY